MLTIHGFLRPEEVGEINRLMDTADFDDGRSTAHGLAAQAKANQQVSRACPAAAALDRIVEAAIRRSRVLVEAVSPCAHSQPLYARYVHGAAYGPHVDAVMNGVPPIRQDLSMTIFLTDPATYDGGGLSLIGAGGERTTLVFFEGPPEKDKDGEKPKPRLRIYQTAGIPAAPPMKEYAWPVIYLGPAASVQVEVNGEPTQLSRGKTVVVARGKNIVQLTQADREIAAIAVEEPSRRLFVIYGPAQELRGGVVYQ